MDGQQQQQQPVQVLHSLDQLIVMDSDQQPEQPSGSYESDFDGQLNGRPRSYANQPWSPTRATSSPSQASRHNGHPGRQVVVLPCAVRVAPSESKQRQHQPRGQWLYKPAASLGNSHHWLQERRLETDDQADEGASLRPIPLEQLVGLNRHWLQLTRVDDEGQQQQQHANHSSSPASASRLIVGASFLAIERPRRQLSGRYIYQIASDEEEAQRGQQAFRTVCDISVIVRQPIRLQLRLVNDHQAVGDGGSDNLVEGPSAGGRPVSSALARLPSGQLGGDGWSFGRWLSDWLGASKTMANKRSERSTSQLIDGQDEPTGRSALLDDDPSRVRVLGPGRVPQTPIVRIGDRLELNCLVRGHPIGSIRWFRQGQAVNVQSSNGFQTELSTFTPSANNNNNLANGSQPLGPSASINLVSRLFIRQLQPRDFGLQIFECFVQNSLGDRARASLAVYVADRDQLERAQGWCPLAWSARSARITNQPFDSDEMEQDEPESQQKQQQQQQTPNQEQEDDGTSDLGSELQRAGQGDANVADEQRLLFTRRNPFRWALVLEGEPVELQCPGASVGSGGGEHHQIDWFKWTPNKSVNVHSAAGEWHWSGSRPSDPIASIWHGPRYRSLFLSPSLLI